MHSSTMKLVAIIVYTLWLPVGSIAEDHDHAEHDHSAHEHAEDVHKNDRQVQQEHGDHCSHDDHHDHSDHSGHEYHDDGLVRISAEGIKLAGLQTAPAQKRYLTRTIELPGEVGLNEDRVAHVTPRYGGIVRAVKKHLGEYVREGEVLAIIENNETLNRYSVQAPLNGQIIEKHCIRGEYVSEETSIYLVANLASVWIDLDIYPRYLDFVKVGSKVILHAVGIDRVDTGTVSYITPLFDKRKRAATARILLRNRENRWRPGTFVHGNLTLQSEKETLAIEHDAIQILDGEECVFIPQQGGYKPVVVVTGMKGKEYTEIVKGIDHGHEYVVRGAFELKAAMVTSSLDPHAGHGH